MKINPISNPNILRAYQAVKPAKEKERIPGGRDEVTFSEEALGFSKAMAEAKGSIEFRTTEERAHIADVRESVRRGEYNVSSGEVADKILESVLGRGK